VIVARQEVDGFFVYDGVERASFSNPGSNSFIERGSRRAPERQCCPASRAFSEHVNIFFAERRFRMAPVVLVDSAAKAASATGHAGWAAADDDHVGGAFQDARRWGGACGRSAFGD